MTRARETSAIVLIIRWGLPLAFVIFGVVMLVLSHGHLSGVTDNAAESNPFTATSLDHDSILSTLGVGSLVVAVMIWMIGWMLRLNTSEHVDRDKEEDARQYFIAHGRWPDED
jgi:uncharacterized membrane protein